GRGRRAPEVLGSSLPDDRGARARAHRHPLPLADRAGRSRRGVDRVRAGRRRPERAHVARFLRGPRWPPRPPRVDRRALGAAGRPPAGVHGRAAHRRSALRAQPGERDPSKRPPGGERPPRRPLARSRGRALVRGCWPRRADRLIITPGTPTTTPDPPDVPAPPRPRTATPSSCPAAPGPRARSPAARASG